MTKLQFQLIKPVLAHADHNSLPSREEIVQEILKDQNVASASDLNCSQISPQTLEKLGDAIMEENHPGRMHEAMDVMMGGEGSETLKQAHISMGAGYLGCRPGEIEAVTIKGQPRRLESFQEDMSRNMMPWGGYGMMSSWFGTFSIVIQILLVILLGVLIRYFWQKGGSS